MSTLGVSLWYWVLTLIRMCRLRLGQTAVILSWATGTQRFKCWNTDATDQTWCGRKLSCTVLCSICLTWNHGCSPLACGLVFEIHSILSSSFTGSDLLLVRPKHELLSSISPIKPYDYRIIHTLCRSTVVKIWYRSTQS